MTNTIFRVETPGERKLWFPVAMTVGGIMFLGLLYGVYDIIFADQEVLISKDIGWGLLIVAYAYGISSIGLSYIACFGIVLGFKQFDEITKRALFLAIVLVAAAMGCIMLDIGHPERAFQLFLTPHLTSALAMVSISINIYLIVIAAELYVLMTKGHESPLYKPLGIIAFAVAIIVHSFHGGIFGFVQHRALWAGPYYPLLFLLSALYSSCSMIVLITVVTYKVTGRQMSTQLEGSMRVIGNRLLPYLIAMGMFFVTWKVFTGYYYGKIDYVLLVSGPYKYNFWVGEVLIGYVIPFLILVSSRGNINRAALAAFLVLIGLFFSRYNFIIGGQVVPIAGPADITMTPKEFVFDHVLDYSPPVAELAAVIGLCGGILMAYALATKYLNLDEDHQQQAIEGRAIGVGHD